MSERQIIESASHVFENGRYGLRCVKSRFGDYVRGAEYSADNVASIITTIPQAVVVIVKEAR